MSDGDLRLGDTEDFKFNTTLNGVPTTLAGSPTLAAYVDNGTTEITAGLTLTVDLDGKTGYHNVRAVLTAANGYASGTKVSIVLAGSGTVGGSSVTNTEVASFTIGKRRTKATVQTDAGNSATQILTDRAETEVDHWAFALVKITSGALFGQVRKCTGYDGAGTLTFTVGFTDTPADGTNLELVND